MHTCSSDVYRRAPMQRRVDVCRHPRPPCLIRGSDPTLEPGIGGDRPRTRLALCAAATAAAMGINAFIPTVSPLLIAIVLGAVVANVVDLPQRVRPGLSFSAKRLLRVGIALLGLQLLLADVLGLGWKVIVVVIAVVASESRERCSSADYSGSPGPSAS